MKDWIMLIASCIAATTGIAGVIISIYGIRNMKKQYEAQNYNNQLAYDMLRETKKTPSEKKADNLVRRGGFSSHATYLAERDVRDESKKETKR